MRPAGCKPGVNKNAPAFSFVSSGGETSVHGEWHFYEDFAWLIGPRCSDIRGWSSTQIFFFQVTAQGRAQPAA